MHNCLVFRVLYLLSRLLVGVTFVFSGFVKAIYPLGTTYKIQDYLEVMHLSWFSELALVASFALITAEFLARMLLITNVNFRYQHSDSVIHGHVSILL